jgi:cation transport ATPase
MIILTVIVVARYGTQIFRAAAVNWWRYGSLSMDTLITLGSLAALLMATFLTIT